MRRISLYLFILTLSFVACQRKTAKIEDLPQGMHAATVIEAVQGSSYSYFQVFENDQKFWMATNPLQAKEGDLIYYTRAFEMKDFTSKEIKKTFPSIMFVEDAALSYEKKNTVSPGKLTPGQVTDLDIKKANGGISIEELFRDKEKYNGQEVIVRGVIVKYNEKIMGKNWAHIQDGSKFNDQYDLTVTTADTLAQGQIVTFKGKIILNKDFGHGYAYDVIMEDAKSSDVENFEPQI
ncbi:MAG: hypothetical protein ACM3ME_08155 [Chloroflexota bacterium]|jgi:hypothetical protein|nr:hypothetical protein [Lentimicrobium sp.]